jgi:hypothetical protein
MNNYCRFTFRKAAKYWHDIYFAEPFGKILKISRLLQMVAFQMLHFVCFENGRRESILKRNTASKPCTLLTDLCRTIRRFVIARSLSDLRVAKPFSDLWRTIHTKM